MIREEELDDTNILATLQSDPIERNQQLETFVRLLNSINKNCLLTIDGGWGSGKTVFVRQIDYLNKHGLDDPTRLNKDVTQEFQEGYITYYYNAWKNDYHEDPLQSLLFNLINDLWSDSERAGDTVVKMSKGLTHSVLKTLSLGLYDAEEIRNAENISDLVKGITTVDERRRAIDDIINNHLDLKGKKLLFIIDELDRCKPTFAVKLLEVLKHYYTNDKLVFLLSTNNQQLSHTIKKVYGESFDGSGYLNKFYDLIFNLPDVDSEQYIKHIGRNAGVPWLGHTIPARVVSYLGLSMREINRYYSSLRLIEKYFVASGPFLPRGMGAELVKYVFVPLAYGLRIHDSIGYTKFVKGEGVATINDFCKRSDKVRRVITKHVVADEEKACEIIRQVYGQIFATDPQREGDDHDIAESAQAFKRVVTLMNATGSIDEKETVG